MTVSRPPSSLRGSADEPDGSTAARTESTVRLSVNLPRSLYRQFRLHALDKDTTLAALVAQLIRQEISR